jgi:sec-independent protein translocase protein TatA
MGTLGLGKLLLIGIVILVFFWPSRIPELGRALGKGLHELRKASRELHGSPEESAADAKKDEHK